MEVALNNNRNSEVFLFADRRQDQARREAEKYAIKCKEQRLTQAADELSNREKQDLQDDHLNHLLEHECRTVPDVNAIDRQTEIQWYMRPFLIDFLIEAHAALRLLPHTLHLAVNILDRYCSRRIVYRKHYQLLGCTALLIASKFEEAAKKVPRIHELRNMCCNLYEDDMFVQMERHVMDTIEWLVSAPTAVTYLEMLLDDSSYEAELASMSFYISEIALFHKAFVSIRPSDLARATLALSRMILSRAAPSECWATQYDGSLVVQLSQILDQASSILQQKYKANHFSRVSLVLQDFLRQHEEAAKQQQLQAQQNFLAVPEQLAIQDASAQCVYSTPTKQHYIQQQAGITGWMTPPITPDTENFNKMHSAVVNAKAGNHLPPTPPTGPGSNPLLAVQPRQSFQHQHEMMNMVH